MWQKSDKYVGTKQENIWKERELRQEKIEGKTMQKLCYQEKAAVW